MIKVGFISLSGVGYQRSVWWDHGKIGISCVDQTIYWYPDNNLGVGGSSEIYNKALELIKSEGLPLDLEEKKDKLDRLREILAEMTSFYG